MSQPKKSITRGKTKSNKLPSTKKLPARNRNRGNKDETGNIIVPVKSSRNLDSVVELLTRSLPASSRTKMPGDLKPMLATLTDEPFTDSRWQFEIKLDGYRTLAYLKKGKADLRSRNNLSFNTRFKALHHEMLKWNIHAVVDGEIVVLDENGRPDFNSIQHWEKNQEGQLAFYVFDILWLEGYDLMNQPLYKRREILQQLMPESGMIRFSDHIEEAGTDFYEIAKKNNLEGIIAKRMDSLYVPDSRSRNWLKIKIEERHEAIICGFSRNHDSDRLFSSLVLGVYDKGKLTYIGQTGTGFTEESMVELMKKMKPHITKDCAFEDEPETGKPTEWLKPFLVCEVKYTELTREGIMRHPSFQGLRTDKTAFELNEEEDSIEAAATPEEVSAPAKKLSGAQQIVTIEGQELKLTNLQKPYWNAKQGNGRIITKGDLVRYYQDMAEFIMPYMKDRPQSLNRYPDGMGGESFYHKNMSGKVDSWLKTFRRISESKGEPKDFLICTNTASLIYMANLGCIEMNPWHSRVQTPLYPDWSVIDLDPGDISFEKVIETARMVKDVLDSVQIPSWPKTSGSTGIHIYIPLGAKYNYEQSKQFAELIANLVHAELPGFTSIERNPEKRKDRIYIDYLQNRPIQTISAPYSVRPRQGATVSAPLHWDEVKPGLKISDFNMHNMHQRVKDAGDLFTGVLGKGIDLNKVLKGLAGLLG